MNDFWSTVGIFMAGYALGSLFSIVAGASHDAKRLIEDSKTKETDK